MATKRFIWFALALTAAACGGSSPGPGSPIAPSPVSPSSQSSGATIQGTVSLPGLGTSAHGPAVSGTRAVVDLTVQVTGTGVSTPVDAQGRFTLTGVPAGDVVLRFFGAGVDATAPLPAVRPNDTITIVVNVSATSATIVSDSRGGLPASGPRDVEGRIEAIQPQDWIVVAAVRILVPADTPMREGGRGRDWSDLRVGVRVHVTLRQDGTDLVATSIEIQNTNEELPVTVNGIVTNLTGDASAFTFTVDGRVVKGDTQTEFFGDGDRRDSFASLASDRRVEVKGQQRDGHVYAVRIHVNQPDDDSDEPQEDSASIHGTLNSVSGVLPNLTLVVGTTTVRTSGDTEVKRRGDRQALDVLRVGQSLHVVAVRRSDGSLDARKIEIDDDAAGGEFEIEGALGGLKGTCPAITFGVNGYAIATDAATSFKNGACSTLKSGDKVKVKGTRQASGTVAATEVEKRT